MYVYMYDYALPCVDNNAYVPTFTHSVIHLYPYSHIHKYIYECPLIIEYNNTNEHLF